MADSESEFLPGSDIATTGTTSDEDDDMSIVNDNFYVPSLNGFQDTNDYQEFKLKINLWKLIDNHQNNQFAQFISKLCVILSNENKLQTFKHSFIKTLFELNMNTNTITKINAIDTVTNNDVNFDTNDHEQDIEDITTLNNINSDMFLCITSFLQIQSIILLQCVDRELLLRCYDPMIFKHQEIEWIYDRYIFHQNLSHWRFDKVEKLKFQQAADYYFEHNLEVYLNVNAIPSNINQNWIKSVKQLTFIYQHASHADRILFETLPRFENVETLIIAGSDALYHPMILKNKVIHNKLRDLEYHGEITKDVLNDFIKCSDLESLSLRCNYFGVDRDILCVDINAIIKQWRCVHLQNVEVSEVECGYREKREIQYNILQQLIVANGNKVDLNVVNQGHINDVNILFKDANILHKLKGVRSSGYTDIMMELMKLLSQSMSYCFKHNEKLQYIDINCWEDIEPSPLNVNGMQMVDFSGYIKKFMKHCDNIKISLLYVSIKCIMEMIEQLALRDIDKNTIKSSLWLRCMIKKPLNEDMDQEKRSIIPLLKMIQCHQHKLIKFCKNIEIEINDECDNANYQQIAANYNLYYETKDRVFAMKPISEI